MEYLARKTELARMGQALAATRREIQAVEAQVKAEALAWVQATTTHPRLCGRYPGASNWRRSDQRLLDAKTIHELRRRMSELLALGAKRIRQEASLADLRRRWGVNELAEAA